MKRNIDLTENMMFSRNHGIVPINLRSLEKRIGRKVTKLVNMGDELDDQDSLIDREKQLFPLGDKMERMFIKECIEMDSGNFCDCCGASLKIHPWNRLYGLCAKCADYIDKKYNKEHFPWSGTIEVDTGANILHKRF